MSSIRSLLLRHGLALLLGAAVVTPDAARAQTAQDRSSPAGASAQADSNSAAQPASAQPAFFETLTVSATLNPATVKDTPGTVSVIDAKTIERRLIENVADLVKFEPGVYIESNPTRVGLNGFNVRGIGGNRVMTQVDGVDTSEQFDFGPFNVHQFTLDLDALKSAEIVRSAGSALYGSDALGGVVSLFTKDPVDYLGSDRRFHVGGKTLFDGRANDASGNAVVAGAARRAQASMFVSYSNGHEPRNRGDVRTDDATRTALNPQDRDSLHLLGKVTFTLGDGNILRASIESADTEVETTAYSLRSAAAPDVRSNDVMTRRRVSLDQSMLSQRVLTQLSWSVYAQQSDTDQAVDELRAAAGPTPRLNRHGTLAYEQRSVGATLQARKAYTGAGQGLLTFGGSYKRHTFDMLRDRLDIATATGAVVPATNLTLPTKYFPKTGVGETGVYGQGEVRFGRVLIVPGIRFDRFSLDADANDRVFLATLSPAAADFAASAVSSKVGASIRVSDAITVHAQYAGGFRAPPYSALNSGFTNLQGGYTSIPNTDLRPETSDNLEAGLRASLGRVSLGLTAFSNRYDDFINQVLRGANPATGLLEYQYQNAAQVEIHGLELQADARLTSTVRLRASYAAIRGNDVSGANDVPLDTIAPDQGVVGLAYAAPSNRLGMDVSLRSARGQSPAVAGAGFFAPEPFAVADVTGWLALTRTVTLRAGVMNLTDAKYFEWPNVRGRQASDPVIDRYSSPGVSGLVSLSYGW